MEPHERPWGHLWHCPMRGSFRRLLSSRWDSHRPASHPLCVQGRAASRTGDVSESTADVLRRPDIQSSFSSSQHPGLCRNPVVTLGGVQTRTGTRAPGFTELFQPHTECYWCSSFSGRPVLKSGINSYVPEFRVPDLGCCRVGSRGAREPCTGHVITLKLTPLGSAGSRRSVQICVVHVEL